MTTYPLKSPAVSAFVILGNRHYGVCKALSMTLQNQRKRPKHRSNVVRFIRPGNLSVQRPDGLPNR